MLDAMPGGGDAHLELLDDAGEVIGLATIMSRDLAYPAWHLRDLLQDAIREAGYLDWTRPPEELDEVSPGRPALLLRQGAGELIGRATVESRDPRFPVARLLAILAGAWRDTVTAPARRLPPAYPR